MLTTDAEGKLKTPEGNFEIRLEFISMKMDAAEGKLKMPGLIEVIWLPNKIIKIEQINKNVNFLIVWVRTRGQFHKQILVF